MDATELTAIERVVRVAHCAERFVKKIRVNDIAVIQPVLKVIPPSSF
jgi:hypothetical protein